VKIKRVIGFGAMNLDELYRVQSVLADDETPIREHKSTSGGSAANTIYGLAKLGINTGFVGAVGSDEAGTLLLQDFKSVGTDCSQVRIKEHSKTGLALGLTDSHGNRALYVAPMANSLLRKEDISLEYMAQAELIHISSFVDDEQFEVQKWLVNNLSRSIRISFTPGAIYTRRGLSAIDPILARTSILFANEGEIEELTGTHFRAAARYLINRGCEIVIVTLGRGTLQKMSKVQLAFEFHGQAQAVPVYGIPNHVANKGETEQSRFASYVADAHNEYVIESQPGHRVDTTGAGDAFASGFLYGLLKEKGLEECGRLGDIVAQFSISKIGAREGLPNSTQLAQRYQEFYSG